MVTICCSYCNYCGNGNDYDERIEDVERHEKECSEK